MSIDSNQRIKPDFQCLVSYVENFLLTQIIERQGSVTSKSIRYVDIDLGLYASQVSRVLVYPITDVARELAESGTNEPLYIEHLTAARIVQKTCEFPRLGWSYANKYEW